MKTNQPMKSEIKSDTSTVSWREILGNKVARALHPAMLTDQGYKTTQKAALVGQSKSNTNYVTVIYTPDYVKEWLTTKVVKPLGVLPLDDIQNLIAQAYKDTYNIRE